ncbi:MAG: putative hydrolase [Bacillales bacterium]|jgi:uncharacterized protein|nr:putative hydrolase [Bacillales bacterium]
MNIRKEIQKYIENTILPTYSQFDKAHQIDHARIVIDQSLEIAKEYPVDMEMVYVIAAYHDLGLQFGREKHEINSGKLLIEDQKLKQWFNNEQLEQMKEAVEDHRASNKTAPRSLYGMIVAEADRLIDYNTILFRTIQFGLKHYPELSKEDHFERTYQHIEEKYGENGYLKLWLQTKKNCEALKDIHLQLKGKDKMKTDFEKIFVQSIK